jgi:flavin-dependent dehydrogenase
VVRVPCFDFGAIERGYGWVFPKDDHSSVGLYTLARGVPQMRARLLEYARARGFDVSGDPLETFQGHQIPIGGHRLRVPDVPVYVVGDAGGFADALTGEGIYHALESGRLAGETVVDVARGRATHRRYYRRLWRSVLPDTWLTYRLSRLFYQDVGRALRVIERPLVWRALVQGSAEGATFTGSLLRGAYFYARSFAGGGAASRNETGHLERQTR